MSSIQQQPNVAIIPRVRGPRLCGNPSCRQPGHTIRYCTHQSVDELKRRITRISDYSIAYQYPEYLRRWIYQLQSTQLTILRDVNSPRGDDDMRPYLFHKYYEQILTTPIDGVINREAVRIISAAVLTPVTRQIHQENMVALGVPVRLSRRQQIANNLADTARIVRERTGQMNLLARRFEDIRREYEASQRVREAAIAVYITASEESDEYQRTHQPVQIQRKFQFNARLKPISVMIDLTQEPDPQQKQGGREPEPVQDEEPEQEEPEQEEPEQDEEPETCPICLDNMGGEECVELNCNHKVCNTCITRYLDTLRPNQLPVCSLCRTGINCMMFSNEAARKLVDDKYCAVVAVVV